MNTYRLVIQCGCSWSVGAVVELRTDVLRGDLAGTCALCRRTYRMPSVTVEVYAPPVAVK